MPKSGGLLQRGYVLHQRSYTDSRVLLELFTQQSGRLTAVARRPTKQPNSQFFLFHDYLLDWGGASELKTLRTCESLLQAPPKSLQGRLSYCGLYLNELILRVTALADPQPRLFDAYQHCLAGLGSAGSLKAAEPLLRQFELVLLEEQGIAFDYFHSFDTGSPIRSDLNYELHMEGGFAQANLAADSSRGIFSGADILAIGRGDFTLQSTLAVAKQVTRRGLAPLLGDKPLKSRELFL